MRLTLAVLAAMLAHQAAAQVPPDVLERAAPAVLRVVASGCPGESRSGTGFAWEAPGRVVTALHVVAGCRRFDVDYQKEGRREARIERSLLDADLVLLSVANPPAIAPLAAAARVPAVGETVNVYGYPFDQPTPSDARLYVTDANRATPELGDAVGAGERQQLQDLGFPSLHTEVLRVDGNLLPGHSGAPILDRGGQVVGIGFGGLQRGAVGVGWAVRARYLADLARAPAGAAMPATSRPTGTLFATVAPAGAGPPVRCGGLSLARTRSLSLEDLVATSDDPGGLMSIAASTGRPIRDFAEFRFDIWTETGGGGGVAVPSGLVLQPGPSGCTARVAGGGLTMTVDTSALRGPPRTPAWHAEVQAVSSAFEQARLAEFFPFLMQDPRFSYVGGQERRGGMVVNRKFFMGQQPGGRPPHAIFENLMAKGGVFIGTTVTNRNYVLLPNLPPDQAAAWIALAFAVHLSTFPP